MNLTEKQKALDILNNLEVIESNGGEGAYILVANNKENQDLLSDVGIGKEIINKYGDNETFCILALAFSEGYCDICDIDGKMILFDKCFEIEVDDNQSIILYKHNDKFNLVVSENNGEISQVKLTNKQVEAMKSVIA